MMHWQEDRSGSWSELLRKGLSKLTPNSLSQEEFEAEVDRISDSLIRNNLLKDDTPADVIYEEIRKMNMPCK